MKRIVFIVLGMFFIVSCGDEDDSNGTGDTSCESICQGVSELCGSDVELCTSGCEAYSTPETRAWSAKCLDESDTCEEYGECEPGNGDGDGNGDSDDNGDDIPIPDTWTDSATGLEWQNKGVLYRETFETIEEAMAVCENLDLNGTGWRLPTLNDLRSVIREAPETQANGACQLTNECNSVENCYSEDDCQPYPSKDWNTCGPGDTREDTDCGSFADPGLRNLYSGALVEVTAGPMANYISSTKVVDHIVGYEENVYATVDYHDAEVYYAVHGIHGEVRCIR